MDFGRNIIEGIKTAIIAPFIAMLVVALGDFDMLRGYLTQTGSDEIQRILALLMVSGFVVGALSSIYFYRKHSAIGYAGAGRELARWYWELEQDGRDLSVREATTSRCIPTADARWALDDLIKELSLHSNATGSDFLDRKVAQSLDLKDKSLKPTQRGIDATRLLELRYHGNKSKYQWDAKTESSSTGCRAYILVRENESEEWKRCLIADGPSAATAITIAAITRETWSFTT